jgi:ATP adenylyltransferase
VEQVFSEKLKVPMDRIYAPWRSKYFTMPKGKGCLFCEVQHEENEETVGLLSRGAHWFVMLNMFPYTSGHLLIVTKRHIEQVGQLSAEEGKELVEYLAKCERAVRAAYRPTGMNIGINIGSSAGAGIEDHLHVHVCPRWAGDTNFMTALAETRVVSEALDESYRKLATHFR